MIFYDTHQAHCDFDENFVRYQDKYIFTDYGNLPGDWEPEYITPSKAEIIKALDSQEFFDGWRRTSWREYFKDYADKPVSRATKAELDEFLRHYDGNDILKEEYYKKNYEVIVTRGYSQGDYAEVIIPHALAQVWGVKSLNFDAIQEQVNRLFWDTPIYWEFEGEVLSVFMTDPYEWDEDEAERIVRDNLPPEQHKDALEEVSKGPNY